MPCAQDVIAAKGSHVHSIEPRACVLDAIRRMNEHKIGALAVMEDDHIVGMFTERDVLRRVVGEERPVADTLVGDVMTTDVICCQPDADLDDVGAIMKNRRIRHLPVCDNEGHILGMVSIGDLNAFNASSQEATIHFLNEYIYGRV
jgi:CBS domain-containing protein